MKSLALVLLLTLAACLPHKHPAPTPFPALPDTVHSEAGPIPVVLVEDISVGDSTQFVIGRYDIFTRTIYIRRGILSPVERQRILAHERCHVLMLETGLHNHTAPWYLELLCNAMAAQRVADLQRGKP
jgi:hypothetical protein